MIVMIQIVFNVYFGSRVDALNGYLISFKSADAHIFWYVMKLHRFIEIATEGLFLSIYELSEIVDNLINIW
jgi:hypothetical protein